MRNGIEISIATQYIDSEIKGCLPITLMDRQSYNFIEIGRLTVWYGDIHFLGYNTESTTAIRIMDASIAEELLQLI